MSYVAGKRKPSRLRGLPSPANLPGSADDAVSRRYRPAPIAGLTSCARAAISARVKPSGNRTLRIFGTATVVEGGADLGWPLTTAYAPQALAPTTARTTTSATRLRR